MLPFRSCVSNDKKLGLDVLFLKIPEGLQSQNPGMPWRTFNIMRGLPIAYPQAFGFQGICYFAFYSGRWLSLGRMSESLGVTRMNHKSHENSLENLYFRIFSKSFSETCFVIWGCLFHNESQAPKPSTALHQYCQKVIQFSSDNQELWLLWALPPDSVT